MDRSDDARAERYIKWLPVETPVLDVPLQADAIKKILQKGPLQESIDKYKIYLDSIENSKLKSPDQKGGMSGASKPMSTGTKIAIGVGSTIIVIVILGGGVVIIRRKKKESIENVQL